MTNNLSRIETELRRLRDGPSPNEKPGGLGTVRFVARCPLGSHEVLIKVISILKFVDEVCLSGWLTDEEWTIRLPDWFTSKCAPPITQEEAEKRLAWRKRLPLEEQNRIVNDMDWSLDGWLYWMQPSNRYWFWWDAKSLDDLDHIIVAVEVYEWPFPWGALRWLFRAAGASSFEAEK